MGNARVVALRPRFNDPMAHLNLEPHHLRRVSDGGPDHPSHVISLCPNCHRRVHASADGETYNAFLQTRIAVIEG
jgi:5-methylcytosine-specific restriction protein A